MDKYKTKDIYEASCLVAKKAKLLTLEKQSNFYWFVFDNLNVCQKISDEYWRNELMVSAKDYSEAIRSLKDRLFARG